MNKYQEVLDKVVEHLMDEWGYEGMEEEVKEILKPLQELVDKTKLRTEEEVLKDFEKLGYNIIYNGQHYIKLDNNDYIIRISRNSKKYKCYDGHSKLTLPIDIEEHKLLNELFQIYGWL